jgi:hypothetical protein
MIGRRPIRSADAQPDDCRHMGWPSVVPQLQLGCPPQQRLWEMMSMEELAMIMMEAGEGEIPAMVRAQAERIRLARRQLARMLYSREWSPAEQAKADSMRRRMG